MIRPPLGKLHHYESRTALVRGTNHRCGREPGTIESRGCNTGELTPAAHCGSALIEIERLQYLPPYPPPYWQSVKSTVLHTTTIPASLLPTLHYPYPSYGLITPAQSEEVKKLTPRLNRRFINYADPRFRENADGLIRQPSGNRY